MKQLTSILFATLVSNLVVGCTGGDNITVEPFPQTCTELAAGDASATDGEQTLYIGNDETKPWSAFCLDMNGTPKEYLSLDGNGAGTWSQYRDANSPDEVRTTFSKLRIDPISLELDIGDRTFAVSSGSITQSNGTVITSMPLGVAMSCGGGFTSAEVAINNTPFLLATNFVTDGAAGHTGHGEMWESQQVMEMWADGDCGWIAPESAPANPMNDVSGYLIALTYKK